MGDDLIREAVKQGWTDVLNARHAYLAAAGRVRQAEHRLKMILNQRTLYRCLELNDTAIQEYIDRD